MGLKNSIRKGLIHLLTGFRLDELSLWRQRSRVRKAGLLVLVVEMHETLRADSDRLLRQLKWVSQRFRIITPAMFFQLWAGPIVDPGWAEPAVLFTFDDGRESNYVIAATLLEEMGTRGLFFVVPDFIGLRGKDAREFYYSRIDVRGRVPSESEEVWMPMTPQQLRDLVQRGHAVGSHTLSHASLSGLPAAELENQIVTSAEKIALWTGKSVEAFAWPYAWDAISREAWDSIRGNYRFCFSPCPGITHPNSDPPHLIWRTEIEASYAEPEYRFMYSGLATSIWGGKRNQLKRMLNP